MSLDNIKDPGLRDGTVRYKSRALASVADMYLAIGMPEQLAVIHDQVRAVLHIWRSHSTRASSPSRRPRTA